MSLVNTRIQNLRAKGNMDKNELRPSRYGALDLFMNQTNEPNGILTPELKEKAMSSIGSTLETPVINYDSGITISNTRTVEIADSENTSAMHRFTFATFAWGFTVTPAMFMNNEISMQADFERKFNKYLYKFAETLDNSAIASLSAGKTKVIKDKLNYAVTGNVIKAGWKQRENIVGDINPIMSSNDFYGGIHIVGNAGVESMIRKMAEKGLYNVENKQLEYSDKILHFSSRIPNEVGTYATLYAVESGNLGIMTRFEREALLGTVSRTGHEWGIETLPLVNFPCGTYYYESVGDGKALAGDATADMDRVRKEHYGFAVDVCFVTPYNSSPDTIANPILAIEIASEGVEDIAKVVVANADSNPIPTKTV